MKQKEKQTVRSMGIEDLKKNLSELSEELEKLKVSSSGKSRNLRQAKSIRYRRALIETLIREKEAVHG